MMLLVILKVYTDVRVSRENAWTDHQEFYPSPLAIEYGMVSEYGNLILMQPIYAPFMPPDISNAYMIPSNLDPIFPSSYGISQRQNNYSHPQPPTVPSHGPLKLLQNKVKFPDLPGHCKTPPDLYGSLRKAPEPPPPEDMKPADVNLVPYEQDLRFKGDMYTPKWVRGHGKKRQGWCGFCNPGCWRDLKTSNYLYDKVYNHGISVATGVAFPEPLETRPAEGNPDAWEGLCQSCNTWIILVYKHRGIHWFRHAKKVFTCKKTLGSSTNRK